MSGKLLEEMTGRGRMSFLDEGPHVIYCHLFNNGRWTIFGMGQQFIGTRWEGKHPTPFYLLTKLGLELFLEYRCSCMVTPFYPFFQVT